MRSDRVPRLKNCSADLEQERLKLQLFSAGVFISDMLALNLVKETLSDEMLLIVAAELIVSVPSCSA